MPKKQVTLNRIDKNLATIAEGITLHPDLDLWPYFDLLEAERQKHLDRPNRLKEALNRVK
ncbi:MAG: hypothetical protein COB24_09040 [Hyphomicrobiales bacterium]|nr:MAG: hypothetical protein COB24_09040 [Hyphomicrobiales bacterium]